MTRPLRFCFTFLVSLLAILPCRAEDMYLSEISPLENEKWWGGLVALGSGMPLGEQLRLYDLSFEQPETTYRQAGVISSGIGCS